MPDWFPQADDVGRQDVELRVSSLPTSAAALAVEADSAAFQLEVPGICRYRTEKGKILTIDPHPEAAPLDVHLFLLHSAWPALMLQRGYLPLTGCCLQLAGKNTLLVGHTAAGKSTLAAYLQKRGARVLGDDLVYLSPRLNQVVIRPGLPWLTLWADAATELELSEEVYWPLRSPREDASHRYRFPVPEPQRQALPLDQILFLDSHNLAEVAWRELADEEAADSLLAHMVHANWAGAMGRRRGVSLLAEAATGQSRCWELRRPNEVLSLEALEALALAARDAGA